jgi:hypothetical protein
MALAFALAIFSNLVLADAGFEFRKDTAHVDRLFGRRQGDASLPEVVI